MSDVLAGVRVVEVAQFIFGPAAAGLLADFGADVIKVERPSGDPQRHVGPSYDGVDVGFEQANRKKRSIALDLTRPADRRVLDRLIISADVLITNYLPPAREKLRLTERDVREHNPSIIYAAASAVGDVGPDGGRPGYDATTYWARGGIAATLYDGMPGTQPGAFGDRQAAMNLAFGVAAALFARERTGRGTTVDVSLHATALWQNSSAVAYSLGAGRDIRRQDAPIVNPLMQTYETADRRYVALIMQDIDRFWPDVCSRIGRPELRDDVRFQDAAAIRSNVDECVAELAETFRTQPLDVWRERLRGSLGAWEPVQTIIEAAEDPQARANGYIADLDLDEPNSTARIVRSPVCFGGAHPAVGRAPGVGEHTRALLEELGMSTEDVRA